MFDNILPDRVSFALSKLNLKGLREIRIRIKSPIMVDYGSNFFLGENGIVESKELALMCSFEEIQEIVFRACDCSVYAHEEELKKGFITLNRGERVGLCGEIIYENNMVKTMKNFSSITIRLPHQVPNCSLKILDYLYDEKSVKNTLIIAPPGAGKTTFLRDLCFQLSSKNIVKNLLIIDERGEISACFDGEPQFYVGQNTDIYSFATKKFGLENGVRTLAPSVIAMDELGNSDDITSLNYAIGSGVKILATAHSDSIIEIYKKPYFKDILEQKVFERIVVLSTRNGVGTIEGVYNAEKQKLDVF